ncbi:hypothetical protein RMS29_027630 (plasmid) [Agrobacterium rosae]|uniref:Uncharacterized protein n=1 Tax=Agrobacterium rosae TaxID=1972867 RepID=A0AAW9FNV7_9HYPH|nr:MULTISPECIES: hypothetical protein [Agrobacterium]MCF1501557.1 hypothetical protein [Allorhizobium sp. Av2]MDX8321725.1 hypothetical protein [Agrobacterium sp. rho-8.1]MDX8305188.1 hypothetical protein [Agrobacterium rosae]MDX8311471.1 hypothetical protein [Agrobacterium sp. rho-13.3]MDX8316296.1 hypothetical protein [Agrobacterium rosae]
MVKRAARKPASDKSIRKDGFVFASSGLDAVLVDYLYKQVPDGKRRDQMKRLMLLGLMQELGIQNDNMSFIPPRPIGISNREHPSTLEERFLERSSSTETFNNVRSRLIENDNDGSVTVDDLVKPRTPTSSAGPSTAFGSNMEDEDRPKIDVPTVVEGPESSNDTINGLNIQAFMAFKG